MHASPSKLVPRLHTDVASAIVGGGPQLCRGQPTKSENVPLAVQVATNAASRVAVKEPTLHVYAAVPSYATVVVVLSGEAPSAGGGEPHDMRRHALGVDREPVTSHAIENTDAPTAVPVVEKPVAHVYSTVSPTKRKTPGRTAFSTSGGKPHDRAIH